MFVKEILNYDGYDAEVIVSDGEFEVLCYCFEFNPEAEGSITLQTNFVSNFMITEKGRYEVVSKNSGYFDHTIYGRLVDEETVAVGGLLFNVSKNDIPKDIKIKDFVQFDCGRIDFDLQE